MAQEQAGVVAFVGVLVGCHGVSGGTILGHPSFKRGREVLKGEGGSNENRCGDGGHDSGGSDSGGFDSCECNDCPCLVAENPGASLV